jgi:fucose permease
MPLLLPIAFLAFIALGLPDGILGVAWPSMRAAFSVPLDALGLLLTAAVAGYVLSSFSCGLLLERMRIGTLLAASTWLTAASLAGYALLPSFPALLSAAFLAGLGGGAVDSALNTYAAARFRARSLNWLHASYSLGGFLGPVVMSGVIALGGPWRWGYALVAVAQALLGAVFLYTRRAWDTAHAGAEPAIAASASAPGPESGAASSYRETLSRGKVWLGILAFLLYTGMEYSVAQWGYTLLTEGRGLMAGKAALWISVYWGAFLGGRVLAGLLPLGDRSELLLRVCPLGILAGAGLAAAGGSGPVTLAGLAIVGLAFAPVYPAMVSITPARLGFRDSANAMGFQVAAATVGMALIPGLIGIAAERLGVEMIGWSWLGAAVLVQIGLAMITRRPRTRIQ